MNLETHTELPWNLLGRASGGLSIGIVLQGTYRIVRPLAEGGCGEVYLAAHTRLPGRYAVKLLHRSLVRDTDALSRFQQEAEITASLRHPHIVQVFDFNVTDDGVPYLVMELLEGKPLSQRIATAGAVDPAARRHRRADRERAARRARARDRAPRSQARERHAADGAGVADFVKVLDFGISQASWRPRLTEGERVAGTPQYMSPEQACGLREQIDHRSDQFSLAAIAYTLLTGCEPFRGENPIAVLYEVVHTDPPPPSALIPALGTGDRRGDHARAGEAVRRSVPERACVRERAARGRPGERNGAVRGDDQRTAAGPDAGAGRRRWAGAHAAGRRPEGRRSRRS